VDDVLLDYGMKPDRPPKFPMNTNPKAVILSHAHIDHSGVIPNLMSGGPDVFMTPATRDLTYLLVKDTIKIGKVPFKKEDLVRLMNTATSVSYKERFTASNYEGQLYDAGHIPGSASVHLEGEKSLFYTGDINTVDTKLLKKADYHNYPDVDALIIESTYYGRKHTDREELEENFINSTLETLDRGGVALIPCFSVGRTQEIVMILHEHGLSPYVDGMGLDALEVMERYPSFLNDEMELLRAFNNASTIDPKRRSEVIRDSSIIVTTAGMLNGGPALYYISKLYDDPKSKILLTGYQVEGTNGSNALENNYVNANGRRLNLKMGVELYDFSAHADDDGLKFIASNFCDRGVQTVFMVHGDNTDGFAAWLRDNHKCNAISPTNGDEVVL
jgi:putative mRNA 3-end processing factor